jgi:hypothetical protein
MKTLIMPLALGAVLASALAAFAAESPAPPVHHHHYSSATASAAAKAHARRLRHEGLSRRASSCVKYSCLGY